MSLASRNMEPEELDGESTDLATYQRCLGELAVVNRMTFTHYPTLRWLARATARTPGWQHGYRFGRSLRGMVTCCALSPPGRNGAG